MMEYITVCIQCFSVAILLDMKKERQATAYGSDTEEEPVFLLPLPSALMA
eukprot:gene26907-biopygen17489